MTRLHKQQWLRSLYLGVTLLGGVLEAQPFRPSPKDIGQMVDAALQAVIPPETKLTTFTVSERGVRLDYARTMTAFGYGEVPGTLRSLELQSAATSGSEELLSDCNQVGTKPCTRLGRSTYVYMEPISISGSEAVVVLHVYWATTRSKRTFQSASSTEVYLSRSGSGSWTFVKTGKKLIS